MKQITFILALCCIATLAIAQGVDEPGAYAGPRSHVEGCYRTYYKAPEKLDTLTQPEAYTAHRIWRIISLKSEVNKPLFVGNSKDCGYTDLLDIIKYGLMTGKIHAFSSDKFSKVGMHPLSKKEVMNILVRKDTVTETVFDANGEGTTQTRAVNEEIQSASLSGYVICEDWYMDEHWARREKRVICICPVYFNEKQQRDMPLFYLYYNECRDLFSSFRAFDAGGGEYLTYDELFLKKHFESVVVKASNVFGRAFSEYTLGQTVKDEGDASMRRLLNEEADQFDH